MVQLSPRDLRALQAIADDMERPLAWVARRGIRLYISQILEAEETLARGDHIVEEMRREAPSAARRRSRTDGKPRWLGPTALSRSRRRILKAPLDPSHRDPAGARSWRDPASADLVPLIAMATRTRSSGCGCSGRSGTSARHELGGADLVPDAVQSPESAEDPPRLVERMSRSGVASPTSSHRDHARSQHEERDPEREDTSQIRAGAGKGRLIPDNAGQRGERNGPRPTREWRTRWWRRRRRDRGRSGRSGRDARAGRWSQTR